MSQESPVWHPFTPFEGMPATLHIEKGEGAYLISSDGRRIFDAISSWWVNLHGHGNPQIAKAISNQAWQLEQVIFAGFTHSPAERLAQSLIELFPGQAFSKVFYSDNGSTAVEVALKMCFQYWHNQGKVKPKMAALKGAYHGDTFGSMSVGEKSPFNAPFQQHLFEVSFFEPAYTNHPLTSGTGNGDSLQQLEDFFKSGQVAGFIYEPLIQGASGMQMYSKAWLEVAMKLARKYDVLCIADEVMTGFGRTGQYFASQYLETLPDLMCLSKGITGGFLPLGATLCVEKITQPFRSPDLFKTFFHGHSYTANPLACAAANASLLLLLSEECQSQRAEIQHTFETFSTKLNANSNFRNTRVLGTILATELNTEIETSYFNEARHHLYSHFLDQDILIRPLGNVLYILPPYVSKTEDLEKVYQAFLSL